MIGLYGLLAHEVTRGTREIWRHGRAYRVRVPAAQILFSSDTTFGDNAGAHARKTEITVLNSALII